ncbi:MAG: DUF393 domain-containing protein [Desulfocapsa sp.]|nr:DUF393 domain-containing protein [Desulfocapsa sp.]
MIQAEQRISPPITIFFDGSCSVCAREIKHYKSKDLHEQLILVDISEETFDPTQYEKTIDDFMAQMHVRDQKGIFFYGVDAFPAIWAALPGRFFHFSAIFLMLPGVHLLASLAYSLFARYRKTLFPAKNTCKSGTCSINHSR